MAGKVSVKPVLESVGGEAIRNGIASGGAMCHLPLYILFPLYFEK